MDLINYTLSFSVPIKERRFRDRKVADGFGKVHLVGKKMHRQYNKRRDQGMSHEEAINSLHEKYHGGLLTGGNPNRGYKIAKTKVQNRLKQDYEDINKL